MNDDALLAQIEYLTREKESLIATQAATKDAFDAAIDMAKKLRAELDAAKVDADTSGNYVADRETEPRMVTFSNRRIVRVVGDGYLEIEHATK